MRLECDDADWKFLIVWCDIWSKSQQSPTIASVTSCQGKPACSELGMNDRDWIFQDLTLPRFRSLLVYSRHVPGLDYY
jgi:hypothetical protein